MKDINILKKFAHTAQRGFRPELGFKLNRKEVELLMLLERKPNKPMHGYGRHLRMEKGSFTYVVDLLEAKDLVERRPDEEDKRKRSISITAKGKDAIKEIKEQHDVFIENRFAVFTEEEENELNEAIETIERLLVKLPDVKPHHKRGHHGKGRCHEGRHNCEDEKKED